MDPIVNRSLHWIRRFLGELRISQQRRPFSKLSRHYALSNQIVKAYYILSLLICFTLLPRIKAITNHLDGAHHLWPVSWLDYIDPMIAGQCMVIIAIASCFLALHYPKARFPRVLFAASFLCVAAIPNSFGSINHGLHVWLWVAIIFCLLPTRKSHTVLSYRMYYINVIVMAQSMVLLFYTMSGYWKFTSGLQSLTAGMEGNFSSLALARILANNAFATDSEPLLLEMAISYPQILWPGFLFLIYLQLFSLLVLFRASIHTAWGYALISFHLGTWLFMGIIFPYQIAIIVLLFAFSPFRPEHFSFRRMFFCIPIFGDLASRAFLYFFSRTSHRQINTHSY